MLFTVQCRGVPVGTVDLTITDLSAGRLVRMTGYESIAARVRAASQALLSHGLYGPPASVIPDVERRRARAALRAAAALRLELVPLAGSSTPSTFVNLVEAPADGHVVVIAGFRVEPAAVPAIVSQ